MLLLNEFHIEIETLSMEYSQQITLHVFHREIIYLWYDTSILIILFQILVLQLYDQMSQPFFS